MESKHLELILAIEKYGSLSHASKHLNLTPSALSHQLKNFEEGLGIDLFDRVGNQLLFTAAGKELKERAEAILADMDNLRSRMAVLRDHKQKNYIHGYSQKEAQRLLKQASSVSEQIHFDSVWSVGSTILEVGCGIGAQTEIIAQQNPSCQITAIDIAKDSLEMAKTRIQDLTISNVSFRNQSVEDLISKNNSEKYDHVFICFVLEHLVNPLEILTDLKKIIKVGGSITVIEGDHGSTFFYPENKSAEYLVEAQVELQKRRGGNANIGRQLYPLLNESGYVDIEVSPRQIYVDPTKTKLIETFIKGTFTAMIQGISEDIISEGLLSRLEVENGINGLLDTANYGGVFSYTFFKGIGKH